jgi:hypothetical protein
VRVRAAWPAQGGMGYAVRKLRNAAVMSSIRWRPRHKVWVPGSPSDLRARKPPSWAMERIIWRSEGGCSGGGALLFGVTLDQFGGISQLAAWIVSFGTCGLACLAGAAATMFLPRDVWQRSP